VKPSETIWFSVFLISLAGFIGGLLLAAGMPPLGLFIAGCMFTMIVSAMSISLS